MNLPEDLEFYSNFKFDIATFVRLCLLAAYFLTMPGMDSLVMERRSPKSPLPKSSFPKSPLPKGAFPKSPLPKSPFPKSPMPKSPVPYEKYKSRCAYGFISFFHFRQSHSKKLLSDRRTLRRHDIGDGFTRNNNGMTCHPIDDGVGHMTMTGNSSNAEVKKITGEDTPIEHQLKKLGAAKMEHAKCDPGNVNSRDHKKVPKTMRRSRRLPIYGCYEVATMGHTKPVHDNLVGSSSRKLDSEEELSNQVHPKSINCVGSDQLNEVNLQIHMSAATEAFINQKLIDGKHLSGAGPNHHSKHVMDALEILNSNKDLFLKLLQDPNSLLVKHIEDLRESQVKKQQTKSHNEAKLSDKTCNARECNSCMQEGTTNPQLVEKIVVLQTGPTNLQICDDGIVSNDSPQLHYSLRNVQQSVRPPFFPFEKMKRKLMNTMGLSRKEQLMLTDAAVNGATHVLQGFEQCSKGAGLDIAEITSPEKASFNIGEMTIFSKDRKRKDQMEKVKNKEVGVVVQAASTSGRQHESSNLSIFRRPKRCKHEIYVESRGHLSEPLKNGNAHFLKRKTLKSWDRMSSTSEYDFLSLESPRRKREDGFVTQQMRFSPYSNYEMLSRNKGKHQRENKDSFLSPLKQNMETLPWNDDKKHIDQPQMLETKLNIADKLFTNEKVQKGISFHDDDLGPGRSANILKANNCEISEEVSHSRMLSQPRDTQSHCASEKAYYKAKARANNGSLNFIRLDLPAENQTSASSSDFASSPSSIQRVESFVKAEDRLEQPSPVSVLQQFSIEDISSSFSTDSHPSEPSLLPQQIGMEENSLAFLVLSPLDLKINSIASMEERRSMLKCVCMLLQASGFNLDKLALKCHLSGQLLHPSCDNHKLLCDYFLEVLLESYQCHLRFSPWVSFFIPKMGLVSKTQNAVHEVTEYVNWDPVLKLPPQTLEQLVEKDLTKPGTWMDIRIDIEEIVNAMVESTLEELMIETAS